MSFQVCISASPLIKRWTKGGQTPPAKFTLHPWQSNSTLPLPPPWLQNRHYIKEQGCGWKVPTCKSFCFLCPLELWVVLAFRSTFSQNIDSNVYLYKHPWPLFWWGQNQTNLTPILFINILFFYKSLRSWLFFILGSQWDTVMFTNFY